MTRSHTLVRRSVFAVAAMAAMTVALNAPGFARGSYDGTWSVSVVTEKGDCDRGYRYPIGINNGVLFNAGDTGFDISGRVATNGAIIVHLSYGDKSATGSGRLSPTFGQGSWQGGSCAGSWTAERRG